MRNQVHLITYVDRITNNGIRGLHHLLNTTFKDNFGGIHLLPFFYPIDGQDAGFDPIDHRQVDGRLGDWDDIRRLSQDYDIMADLIVNHISAESSEFLDFVQHGERSEFRNLFLLKETIFKDGEHERDIGKIYRPRPGRPFSKVTLKNGTDVEVWTTFTSNQVDIDLTRELGKQYLDSILNQFHEAGIKLVRLDAVGYAIKQAGSSCFMLPETYRFIDELCKKCHQMDMKVLVEIHSHYSDQIRIASHVDYVYDFALPPLILHGLFRQAADYIAHWLAIRPSNAITVLDTHDGIGIIDVGRCQRDPRKEGILPEKEISYTIEEIHRRTKGQSLSPTGPGAKNLDLYQVNTTYYDALGRSDDLYLMARAIQFFIPGIPQVYYMGFLAEPNDMLLFEKTGVGRNVNRHYFSADEIDDALNRPVVRRLVQLIHFRNNHPSFNGTFNYKADSNNQILFTWKNQKHHSQLRLDFKSLTFKLSASSDLMQTGKYNLLNTSWS